MDGVSRGQLMAGVDAHPIKTSEEKEFPNGSYCLRCCVATESVSLTLCPAGRDPCI